MKRKQPLDIFFFMSEASNQPVRDFLLSRTRDEIRKIVFDIYTVLEGFPLGLPFVRKEDKNLWEVRSTIPNGICRIFFTITNAKMVLLHGFIKKTRKTPQKEVDIARNRLKEFKKPAKRINR